MRRLQEGITIVGLGLLLAAGVCLAFEWLTARETWLSLHDADVQQARDRGSGQEIYVLGQNGRVVILAHPPSRLAWQLQLRPGTHRFETFVGIDSAVLTKSDGVSFRVSVADDQAEREIAHADFAPDLDGSAWKRLEASFRTSGGTVRIALETGAGGRGNDSYDWALWAEPTVREGTSPASVLLVLGLVSLGIARTVFSGSISRTVRPGAMQRVGLLYLGCVLALIGHEVGLRAFPLLVPESAAQRLPHGGALHYGERTDGHRWDDELGYLPLAGRCWEYPRPEFLIDDQTPRGAASSEQVEFCTDADGFRNPSDLLAPAIGVIGDSFVQGATIPLEHAWTTLLGDSLDGSVLNLGVGGFAPQQSVIVLKRFGLPRRPSLVLFAIYEGNDIDDTEHYRAYRKSQLRWDAFVAAIARMNSNSRTVQRYQWMRLWAVGSFGVSRLGLSEGSPRGPLNPATGSIAGRPIETAFHRLLLYRTTRSRRAWVTMDAWEMARDSLARARELCAEAGARMVVVLFPSKESIYPALLDGAFSHDDFDEFVAGAAPRGATPRSTWYADHLENRGTLNRLLVEHLEREDYDFVDLTPGFAAAAAKGQALYWPFDTHMSTRGNALAAELVTERLNSLEGVSFAPPVE